MNAISWPANTFERLWRWTLGLARSRASLGEPPAVRVAGRAALTPTHSVHVIEAAGERIVVGCHAQGMTVLARRQETSD